MPSLSDLRSRWTPERELRSSLSSCEEALVADTRGQLTPAQMVEQKLGRLLPKPRPAAAIAAGTSTVGEPSSGSRRGSSIL